MRREAVTVVPASLEAVEKALRDVSRWPEFLVGLERADQTSYGRYTFTVRDRVGAREVEVVVGVDSRDHRMSWHALAGSRFAGQIRLAEVDASHTRVHLSLTEDPAGFLSGLGELARLGGPAPAHDLRRLERMVARG